MSRIKKSITVFFVVLMILQLTSCGKKNHANSDEMPPIVFMCISDLSEVAAEGEPVTQMTFMDQDGNQYITDDSYFDDKSCLDICQEFSEGKLDEYITLRKTIDINELKDKYQMVQSLTKNKDYKVDETSEINLDVLAIKVLWVGFYYNSENELSLITLQTKDNNGIHYANEEEAVKICEWYKNSSIIEE